MNATYVGQRPAANGRTKDVVECACGCVNHFSRWSWAGHGKARCLGCGAWILYMNLEVKKA